MCRLQLCFQFFFMDWLHLLGTAAAADSGNSVAAVVSSEVSDNNRVAVVVASFPVVAGQDWLGLVADEFAVAPGDPAELQVAVAPNPAELQVDVAPNPAELQVALVPDPAELQVAVLAPKPRYCLPGPKKRSAAEHRMVSATMHLAKLRKKRDAQSEGNTSNYEYLHNIARIFFILQSQNKQITTQNILRTRSWTHYTFESSTQHCNIKARLPRRRRRSTGTLLSKQLTHLT